MANYQVEIDGGFTLTQINSAIAGEEAGASEFVDSVIGTHQGKLANLAIFKELAPGTTPPRPTIAKQGDPAPVGTTKVWSGVMLVQGTSTAVVGYRRSGS
jgi:hypothetical protein